MELAQAGSQVVDAKGGLDRAIRMYLRARAHRAPARLFEADQFAQPGDLEETNGQRRS